MNVRPLRGRAVVRRAPERTYVTPGGVIVPDTSEEFYRRQRQHRATIVRLGPPAWEHEPRPSEGYAGVERPWFCAPGDEVLYVYGLAVEHNRDVLDGLHVVGQEEILAVIEPAPAIDPEAFALDEPEDPRCAPVEPGGP